jgi:hypothetical protein
VALVAWGAGAAVYQAETTYVHWMGGTLPSLAASMAVYLALSLVIGVRRRRSPAVRER